MKPKKLMKDTSTVPRHCPACGQPARCRNRLPGKAIEIDFTCGSLVIVRPPAPNKLDISYLCLVNQLSIADETIERLVKEKRQLAKQIERMKQGAH